MRIATLYTLQAREIPVYSNEWVRVYGVGGAHLPQLVRLADTTLTDETYVKEIRLPLHRVCKCTKPSQRLLNGEPPSHNVEEYYLALEPALQEILMAALNGDACKREDTLRSRLAKSEEDVARLGMQLRRHTEGPLWRRLLNCLRPQG